VRDSRSEAPLVKPDRILRLKAAKPPRMIGVGGSAFSSWPRRGVWVSADSALVFSSSVSLVLHERRDLFPTSIEPRPIQQDCTLFLTPV